MSQTDSTLAALDALIEYMEFLHTQLTKATIEDKEES